MAATALAQEKIWLDKPSYDKAERLHFERLAKDNGSQGSAKHSKCHGKSAKAAKKVEEHVAKQTDTAVKIDNQVDVKDKEVITSGNATEKYKPKEVKEKKNKADKKHRKQEEEKNNTIKQIEQLPITNQQGTQQSTCPILPASGSLANEVAKARQHIKQSLQCMDGIAALAGGSNQEVMSRVSALEKENQDLRNMYQELKILVEQLGGRVVTLEEKTALPSAPVVAVCPPNPAASATKPQAKDADDDVDLFGSDSEGEDAEAAKIREERIAAYAAKKSKKPALIAKSNIILDVKPWDDETDMKLLETEVRKIEADGLLWGAAKLVPLAFGIHKLQISCVVEDEKISVDWLTEKIQELEDFVQSVDIAAFNKV
ncbi:probable elongation factor 1-delta isoform X3 [Cephus cinctus]|uniref:Probable elongation factor 1-delta isoform X3 n=1 Tax=Cephus cinctus TaxID=211228 RepID=A0AAJ7BKK7_CEPCN|nr:probable elongation factor 1-delta isoform X3 [Cephus cinctus]